MSNNFETGMPNPLAILTIEEYRKSIPLFVNSLTCDLLIPQISANSLIE